jgi:hypothetical protein
MAKQVKAYVEVETYVELSQGRSAYPSTLLSSALITDEFGTALTQLAESASGAGAPARIVSGPDGVGKSTVLTVVYVLASRPESGARSSSVEIRAASAALAGGRLVPVYVDASDAGEDLLDAIRAGLDAEANAAVLAGIGADEWTGAALGEDPVEQAGALLPSGARLLLIVDGVSDWLRRVGPEAGRRGIALLASLGEATAERPLSVLLALGEDDLARDPAGPGHGGPGALLKVYQDHRMSAAALVELCDKYIFKKDERQRAELHALYQELKQTLPSFRWSQEEFTALYPLHPVLLEVAPALRRHAVTFSFPRFAANAANRVKGRRGLSLVVLDEPFDAFEYELRKAPGLAGAFETYDFIANTVVPTLPDSQHRLWGKLLLKGLFLCSLADRAVTAVDLSNAMMLYDEADVESGARTVDAILARFEERAADRFQIQGEGADRSYRLLAGGVDQGLRALDDIAREVPDSDPALADALVSLGAAHFADWPLDFGQAPGAATLRLPWRGTWRDGLLSYRVPAQLVEIPPLETGLLPAEFDPLAVLTDDLLDIGAGDGGATATSVAVEETVQPVAVEFVAADSICEYDWEVVILPTGEPVPPPTGVPTLAAWRPAPADEASLGVLRRLVTLRSGDPRLDTLGLDLQGMRVAAEAEAARVFHKLYVEGGTFVGQSWAAGAAEVGKADTLVELLGRALEPRLDERYPQHPVFGVELDEATVDLLVSGLFGGGTVSAPEVQQAAAAVAVPLGLAEGPERGPYRFNPSGEAALTYPFNVEPLRLAEAGGEIGVPLEAIYQALRRTPFGLQRQAQRLILAAMVATGRVKLVGPAGELSAEGLAEGVDFSAYTHLKRAGLTVYSNETLLEWCRQLTDSHHLNDIVTADGRQLIRKALDDWLANWHALDLNGRFNEIPPEAATRRTWQLIATSKQYFETMSRSIRAVLDEEVALEEGIGRVVNTFAANPAIYQRAVRDLRMLTGFVDWIGTYTSAKEYILAAERTSDPKIEAARAELLSLIAAPHRLLDEAKRRRFDSVYDAFRRDYIDYYASAHDLHVGSRADYDVLEAYLESPNWRRFELLSQVAVAHTRYYQLALSTVQAIRDLHCSLPTREILLDRASCVCPFRLTNAESTARLLERLHFVVERGTAHHLRTIAQHRKHILAGLRALEADASYADASEPLMALLSGSEGPFEVTPSAVDLINRCLAGHPAPVTVAPPPLELGEAVTKESLRERLLSWLDELPAEEGALIEIGRVPPEPRDE